MSLDVYLTTKEKHERAGSGIFIRENGSQKEISREEWDARSPGVEPCIAKFDDETNTVHHGNITHNLCKMALECDLHRFLWRPEEIGIRIAAELIEPLQSGLDRLKANPEQFKAYNPANGWGDYDGLVAFVDSYLKACREFPNAEVEVSR